MFIWNLILPPRSSYNWPKLVEVLLTHTPTYGIECVILVHHSTVYATNKKMRKPSLPKTSSKFWKWAFISLDLHLQKSQVKITWSSLSNQMQNQNINAVIWLILLVSYTHIKWRLLYPQINDFFSHLKLTLHLIFQKS